MEGGGEPETETHSAAKSGQKGNQQLGPSHLALGLGRDTPIHPYQPVGTRGPRSRLSLSLQLIQFLLSLVQTNGILGVKRKMQVCHLGSKCAVFHPAELTVSSLHSPLMLNDSSTAHSMPKYSRPFSLEVTVVE